MSPFHILHQTLTAIQHQPQNDGRVRNTCMSRQECAQLECRQMAREVNTTYLWCELLWRCWWWWWWCCLECSFSLSDEELEWDEPRPFRCSLVFWSTRRYDRVHNQHSSFPSTCTDKTTWERTVFLKKNKQTNYALKPCFANLNNEILWKTNCLFSKQMLSGKHQIIKKKKNKMLWQCSCWTEGKSNVTFRRPSSFLSKAHCCLHCSQVCGGPYFFSEFVQRWHFVPMNAAMMLQYWHGFGC